MGAASPVAAVILVGLVGVSGEMGADVKVNVDDVDVDADNVQGDASAGEDAMEEEEEEEVEEGSLT